MVAVAELPRKKEKKENNRRWTIPEIDFFADVLVEPENAFAITLAKMALKKSSNNEVFECIGIEFREAMMSDEFKRRNSPFLKKSKNEKLDISAESLRAKDKWLKSNGQRKLTELKMVRV